jgi:hypothetical protein
VLRRKRIIIIKIIKIMEWTVEVLEKIASWILDAVKAARKGKSRRLHIFVLKAMGRTDLVVALDIIGHRFDLFSIDRNLRLAQQHEALGGDEAMDNMALFGQDLDRKEYQLVFKKQAKLGLPGLGDCDRQQKLENILHDMVEVGKLRFHPPNMWSVL